MLEALAEGLSGSQITKRPGISASAVYAHLHNLRARLGAANNKQLLKFAREAGLPPPTCLTPKPGPCQWTKPPQLRRKGIEGLAFRSRLGLSLFT
ncbi:MAG: helix-turn-helix domain-containing protein [Armatimonadetes bacterium]|nr:helix-turn-helix domain-containing protein [Armatimonadota bacterium]